MADAQKRIVPGVSGDTDISTGTGTGKMERIGAINALARSPAHLHGLHAEVSSRRNRIHRPSCVSGAPGLTAPRIPRSRLRRLLRPDVSTGAAQIETASIVTHLFVSTLGKKAASKTERQLRIYRWALSNSLPCENASRGLLKTLFLEGKDAGAWSGKT